MTEENIHVRRLADASAKVRFPLDEQDRSMGVDAENLWARPLGADVFEIDNIPFYVYGISLGDVVRAEERDGRLEFVDVIRRGGHSTYRILVNDPAGYLSDGWRTASARLSQLGCSFEVAKSR